MEDARHPLGVLPLTMSIDGSDATLALRVDLKPTTDHWIIEADSTWLTADSEVFEEPIVQIAEDVSGSPSTRVVSCTPLLSYLRFHVSSIKNKIAIKLTSPARQPSQPSPASPASGCE